MGRRITGRGPIVEAVLLERPVAFDRARATECLVAIRTTAGWFVERNGQICAGTSGPSSHESHKTVAFEVDTRSGRADLVHVFRRTTRARTYDVDPSGVRVAGVLEEFRDQIVVCGLGPAMRPACILPMSIGCGTSGDAADPVTVRWAFADGVLTTTVTSAHNPEACDVSPGPHSIRFP